MLSSTLLFGSCDIRSGKPDDSTVLIGPLIDSDTTLRMARESKGTTEVGFVNPLGQVVIRNTGASGTDKFQTTYQLGCSKCGHVYGETVPISAPKSVRSVKVERLGF